jgi:homogentisate 1,2-dioxygenase
MFQFKQGKSHTQGHKGIPKGQFEEEQGRKGFFGAVSHLLKPKPSTRWTQIDGPLKPQLFDLVKLQPRFGQWQRLLYNADVALYYSWIKKNETASTESFRNADGETLYFCHQGHGQVLTEYGLLDFEKGTYLMLPKCVGHSFHAAEDSVFLVIESRHGAYREPERGMVGRNAFYDTAAIKTPDLEALKKLQAQIGASVTKVRVKRGDKSTLFSYDEDVYDTVGWKGDFFPFGLHVRDIMPMVSARVHLPPSAHTTFAAHNFVVCTFLPRPLESDEDALKVPFYHQNIDYDEVIFYHDGNFFSRDNLHAGMISLHPAGFPHGPHPKAVEKTPTKTHTDEYAVMVDAWNNFTVDPEFTAVEVSDYWKSWMKK